MNDAAAAAAPSSASPPSSCAGSDSAPSSGAEHPRVSLMQRLSAHSYGQAREIIVKEMRANQEAIARLEARLETLVSILQQAGVDLPPPSPAKD